MCFDTCQIVLYLKILLSRKIWFIMILVRVRVQDFPDFEFESSKLLWVQRVRIRFRVRVRITDFASFNFALQVAAKNDRLWQNFCQINRTRLLPICKILKTFRKMFMAEIVLQFSNSGIDTTIVGHAFCPGTRTRTNLSSSSSPGIRSSSSPSSGYQFEFESKIFQYIGKAEILS